MNDIAKILENFSVSFSS